MNTQDKVVNIMNLYLLRQDINDGLDTYDSCVVCAENEQEAVQISPDKYSGLNSETWVQDCSFVKCKFIGIAANGIKKGVVLASFNAG